MNQQPVPTLSSGDPSVWDQAVLAFLRTDVQFQVWVAEGEEPLPCKYVVTDISGESLVSTVSVFSEWDTTSEIGDKVFTFVPPNDAERIEFLQLGNE